MRREGTGGPVSGGGASLRSGAPAWTADGSVLSEEWDRCQWVGEGQEPDGLEARRLPPAGEPRWTKWQWIGDGQGPAGPRRGLPAAAMDDAGDSGPSGHCHTPSVEHWAWAASRA